MSHIVYYPVTTGIFDITSVGGITYYIIRKESNDKFELNIKINNKNPKTQ